MIVQRNSNRDTTHSAELVVEYDGPKRRQVLPTVVTNSELETFRSCAQKHHFAYRERLRPLVDARPLAVGSIFHGGMAAGLRAGWAPGWRSKPTSERLANQVTAAHAGIDAAVNEWAGTVLHHTRDVDYDRLADESEQIAAMVKWMLRHYFEATTRDLDELVLVEVEQPFEVVVRDRSGRRSRLRLAGVRDVVWYDPAYNALVLGEHKTSGHEPRDLEKRVEMDTQTAGYSYALREQIADGGLRTVDGDEVPRDAVVGRVLWNVLRKAVPREPRVNKDGRVSVAACVTTAGMYAEALRTQAEQRLVPVTPEQAEFMARLAAQGDRFFSRVEWHRTDAEVERWRSETFVDASRIREADRDPTRRTRNTGHCNMPWSLPCPYRSVCLDPTAPELRVAFRVARDVHSEVRAAEVDATDPPEEVRR